MEGGRLSPAPRLLALQALRAIAAAMVMVGHAIGEAAAHLGAAVGPGPIPWTWGVDLFFVISGAVIAISAARVAGRPGGWRRFALARAIRVVPLYWLFTLLMLGALLLAPGQVHSVALDWPHVAASFAFLPWEAENGLRVPILTPGWTLNYEVFFYAATAAVLASGTGIRRAIAMLCGLFLLLALAGTGQPASPTAPWFWTRPLILEFALGALIGLVWLQRAGRPSAAPRWAAPVLGLAGFAAMLAGYQLFLAGHAPRFIAAGLPAAAMVTAAVLLVDHRDDRRVPGWAVALGDSSYALYLSHRFTLRGAALIWPGAAGWGFVASVSLAALAVGHLVFLVVERPLLRRLRARRLHARSPAPQEARS